MNSSDLLNATAQIVSAHLTKNSATIAETTQLVRDVHETLWRLGLDRSSSEKTFTTKAQLGDSHSEDYLICLEDGAKVKTLKRYLRRFSLTPGQYRKKWGLPDHYPMVAPAYSRLRSRLAREIGLGTHTMRQQSRRGRQHVDDAAIRSTLAPI